MGLVQIRMLPWNSSKLSVVLEPFLEKLVGFTRSFWTANSPLNDYDEYIDKKYGGYERLWKKYGPGLRKEDQKMMLVMKSK